MRKRIMNNLGKKIVAVALSLAMMIPLALSQTVVTKAAGTTATDVQSAISMEVLKNAKSDSKVQKNDKLSLERGQEVQIQIKAKADIDLESVKGQLSFDDLTKRDETESKVASNDIFCISGVEESEDVKGWDVGYLANKDNDYYTLSIDAQGDSKKVAAGKVITTIKLKVLSSVDSVNIEYKVTSLKARNTSDNSNIEISDNNTQNIVSSLVENDFAQTRGVSLNLPDSLTERVYTFTTSGDAIKKFSVPVKITQNSGFTGMTVQFTYNSAYISYTGYTLSPQAMVGLSCKTISAGVSNNSGEVTLSLLGAEDVMITGDFITLNFEIARNAKNNDQVTISSEILALANESGTKNDKLQKTSNSCVVRLVDGPKRGDVNMDGSITLIDATYALQYYNGVRDLTDEQQALADVNGDNKVTLVDVLLLLKRCNGENVTFAN